MTEDYSLFYFIVRHLSDDTVIINGKDDLRALVINYQHMYGVPQRISDELCAFIKWEEWDKVVSLAQQELDLYITVIEGVRHASSSHPKPLGWGDDCFIN